jgi:hypothetical protein
MPKLPNSHLSEIGRVITTWSAVDFSLQNLAADLTLGRHVDERDDKDDKAALVPFIGMGTRAMVGLIQALLEIRHPGKVGEWKKFGKTVAEGKAQRDIMAHCIWIAGDTPDKIKPMGMKSVGGLRAIKDEQLLLSDLTDRAAFNIRLSSMIWGWRIRLGYLDAPTEEEMKEIFNNNSN